MLYYKELCLLLIIKCSNNIKLQKLESVYYSKASDISDVTISSSMMFWFGLTFLFISHTVLPPVKW